MMFNNENTTVMMRKARDYESPSEPLIPAMNLQTTPGMLTCINFCGILYFFTVTALIVTTSFAITLPGLYSGSAYWTRLAIALFILFQIFGNFLLVWWCNSICEHVANDALPGCDWRHCADCGINVPPRSHHCPLCRHCIAVRDHHCFFTASCVGRNNQRHFIAFCVDCAIGTAYAVHVAYLYVTTFHGDSSYMYFIFPIACVRWIFGLQSGSSLLFVGFTYICAASFIGAAAVVVWQMFLVVRGQTSHEFMTGRWWNTRSFSPKAVTRNVRCVFGPYWPVVFLCPWPVFPMQGDSGYMKSI